MLVCSSWTECNVRWHCCSLLSVSVLYTAQQLDAASAVEWWPREDLISSTNVSSIFSSNWVRFYLSMSQCVRVVGRSVYAVWWQIAFAVPYLAAAALAWSRLMSSNAFWSRDAGQRQTGDAPRRCLYVPAALNGLCVIVTSLDVLSLSSSSSSKAWAGLMTINVRRPTWRWWHYSQFQQPRPTLIKDISALCISHTQPMWTLRNNNIRKPIYCDCNFTESVITF